MAIAWGLDQERNLNSKGEAHEDRCCKVSLWCLSRVSLSRATGIWSLWAYGLELLVIWADSESCCVCHWLTVWSHSRYRTGLLPWSLGQDCFPGPFLAVHHQTTYSPAFDLQVYSCLTRASFKPSLRGPWVNIPPPAQTHKARLA